MHYLITGGTGFIGRNLCGRIEKEGHCVTVLTRDRKRARDILPSSVRLIESFQELSSDTKVDVIVNLAGQSLASGRWTSHRKRIFVESRVNTTQKIIEYIERCEVKPKLLLSGSAIGFYGPQGEEDVTENSEPTPSFTHDLCAEWEDTAKKAEKWDVRVCLLRTGLVLGQGGMLYKMFPAFKFGLGGPLGGGLQWMSWIHLTDWIGILFYLVKHPELKGPINVTAPHPVRNEEFASVLAAKLNRPALFRMPAFLLRMLTGEMADEILLTGQRVIPKKILEGGYIFKFQRLSEALDNILFSR